MSLKDRIEAAVKVLQELESTLAEARRDLWDAERTRKQDERFEGESDEHWEARKKRNRTRRDKREDVKNHLLKRVEHQRDKIEKLRDKRHEVQAEEPEPTNSSGYATFDGKTVPAWMVPWLTKSRAAGWGGVVVSGVRTAAYSVQLCYGICGAASCPGRCAGASSNHNMEPNQGYPAGAIDVSDYYTFERIQAQIGSPLRNDLPIDPVHFSISGH